MALHYSKNDVTESFDTKSWQHIVYKEMASTLNNSERSFPCVYGTAGYKSDQLRYSFIDGEDIPDLGIILADYLQNARSFGFNTALIVFFRPGPVTNIEIYRKRFWNVLLELSQNDKEPWPKDIPFELSDSAWEFCFAGEPVFVNCNTPAHIMRQSRRSSTFTLVFQPRWIFDRVLATPEIAEKVFKSTRDRINEYDMLPATPVLGKYGEPGVLEYEQYFLGDDNDYPKCPFANLGQPEENTTQKKSRVA